VPPVLSDLACASNARNRSGREGAPSVKVHTRGWTTLEAACRGGERRGDAEAVLPNRDGEGGRSSIRTDLVGCYAIDVAIFRRCPLHGWVAAPVDGLRPRSPGRTPPAFYESRAVCRVMSMNDKLLP